MDAGVYFAASALVCAVCFLLYACILPRLAFVQYHRKKSRSAVQSYIMQAPSSRSAADLSSKVADADSRDAAVRDASIGEQEVCLSQGPCCLPSDTVAVQAKDGAGKAAVC